MGILGHQIEQRLLRMNHTITFPESMVFLDVETSFQEKENVQEHDFKLAWACYVRRRVDLKNSTTEWNEFDKPYKLCQWILSKVQPKRPLWIFSHNAFFDLQVMGFFLYFSNWGWELEFIYDAGLSYILIIKKSDWVIKVISTTNFYSTSVKYLGDLFGLPKKEVDFTLSSWDEISLYCKRDVEIIKKAMESYFDFIREQDLGKFAYTKAGQAFAAFRHKFMSHKIWLHRSPEVIDLEKDAYFGGRVECQHLGLVKGGPFITLDINATYPYVMSKESYPTKFIAYEENYPLKYLEEDLTKWAAVAEVLLDTDVPRYAVKQNGKLIFPQGRFRTYLCTKGLKAALKAGHLKGVIAVSFYQQAPIFKNFVDTLYSLRIKYKTEKNLIYSEIVKVLMNSLYGKFAQWRPVQFSQYDDRATDYSREEFYDEVRGIRGIEYKLMNTIVTETGKELAGNSFIAIAAHVTENARLLLDDIMEKTGRDKIIYVDTDSLKIRKKDLPSVKYPIESDTLGSLKIENETNHLCILGPKSYWTEKETKFKGVPKTAVEVQDNVFVYWSFPKQKTFMRQNRPMGYQTKKVIKKISMAYDKGTVHEDGSISPFVLSEF